MEMIEVKTAELIGPALDWAVDVATADLFDLHPDRSERIIGQILCGEFSPSTDWAQGGPLIDRHKVSIAYHNGPDCAPMACLRDTHPALECGETVLIAACRAIVAAKLGDTVRVPAVLVEGEA